MARCCYQIVTNHNEGARDSTNQSLPACTSRTSDGIKGRVPSFLSISFNDAVPTARRFVREIVERSKNTSVSSRGLRSSAISPSCDPGTFDGGASYRLKYRPIRAVLPACNAQWYCKQQHSLCYHLSVINVQHAAGRLPDAITWSDTRAAAGLNRSPAMFVIAGSGGSEISTTTNERCGVGDHRNQDHRHRNVVGSLLTKTL